MTIFIICKYHETFCLQFLSFNSLYINIKALASARGSEKKKKKSKKNPKKNQKNRASAYICFCRLRAKSRI